MVLIPNYSYFSKEEDINLGDYITCNFKGKSYDKAIDIAEPIMVYSHILETYSSLWVKLSYEITSKL